MKNPINKKQTYPIDIHSGNPRHPITGVEASEGGACENTSARLWNAIVPLDDGSTKWLPASCLTPNEAIAYGNGWLARNGWSTN